MELLSFVGIVVADTSSARRRQGSPLNLRRLNAGQDRHLCRVDDDQLVLWDRQGVIVVAILF